MTTAYEVPTGVTRWAIVFAATLGSMVFDLSWIIVGVALPYMQGTFSTTPDEIAWVMTAFIVGGTLMTAATGWASTRFGRKKLFVIAIAANMVTTLMCGLAETLYTEVFWRFVQGMFSAPLLALGQGIILDAFPEEKRGFATGLWTASTVGAVVAAPLLGGYMVETLSWRWVFFISVPVAAVAAVVAWIFIPRSEPDPKRPFEWLGFSALVLLVGTLQLGLSRGNRLDWFESTEICLELGIAAIAFLIVLARTVFVRDSFLERRLFLDRNYLVTINFMLLYGGLLGIPMILMPLMLQQVNGYPAISAGALMLPRGVGLVIAAMGVGMLGRVDPRVLLGFGFLCSVAANLHMSTWTADIDPWTVAWINFVQGMASGAAYPPMVTIALATLERKLHTEAVAFMFLVMNTGKAIGVAAIFVLYTRLLQINYSVLAENVTLTNERLRQSGIPESWDLNTQSGLAALAEEVTRQAQLIAYINAFLAVGVVAALIVPLIFLLKKPRAQPSTA